MYLLELQPRQPVADGAHALRRLRRRRRDRDAREHRPAHGDGQAADARRLRRIEGSRLHDSLDDAVARRRVHPGAVHGRRRRPAAARVRGDDQRRDSGVGLRVDQPDADAVQPLPQAAAHAEARLVLQRDREDIPGVAEALRRDAARRAALPRRHVRHLDRCSSSAPSTCSRWSRRAFCRARIRDASTSAPKPSRGSGSTRWSATRCRLPRSSPRIRTSLAYSNNAGGGRAAAG